MPRPSDPWHPAEYEDADVAAFNALARGEATPEQQVRSLRFIVEQVARYYDISFHPENQRATDFAEGKRFVGAQIVKLTKLNAAALRKNNE